MAVATSGGRDSTALLHCTARWAAAHGVQVVALHVHHGLLPQADHWVSRLRAQVARWARRGLPVRLRVQRLDGAPARGESVEAWARRGRYEALATMARQAGCTAVLLAHHRRDQAETVLLQALRGGGPAALDAMPAAAQRAGLAWLRPWLEQPREAIEAYVRRHRLRHVEDPSNADARFARSRLRLQVWPALAGAFPDAEAALAACARRQADAASAIDEWSAADLAAVADGDALAVDRWAALSPARRVWSLRRWLAGCLGPAVPETLVRRLLAELPGAPAGAAWGHAGRMLRVHRGGLHLLPAATDRAAVRAAERIDLSRPGRHAVAGWHGRFDVAPTDGPGLAAADLRAAELRRRCGGERFQPAAERPARALKKQYQAQGVPAWQRDGPLVVAAGRLLYVPGLGIDARSLAPAGSGALLLRWLPDTPR